MANEDNDRVFLPLFQAVGKLDLSQAERDETIANYMFMFEENGNFAYKHYWTRQYVYFDQDGGMQGGILNTGDYSFPSPPASPEK